MRQATFPHLTCPAADFSLAGLSLRRQHRHSIPRFAYDDKYIYVAIDRTDKANSKADTNFVYIATKDGYIDATISYGEYTLPAGVTGATKNATGGRVYELAFDRAALGLTGDSVLVCPGLYDEAADVTDSINGIDIKNTSTWIKINLK